MAETRNDRDQDTKTDWAEDRTDWAEDRTLLANERTFAAWMRTGTAAIAIALGLRAVFDASEPSWLPRLIATLFLGAAIFIFWSARRQAGRAIKRLDPHDAQMQSTKMFTTLAVVFSLSAVAVGVILWTL